VDFVKVLDFGLVKAFAQTPDLRVSLTRDHVVQGTPAFMAPEQALGGAEVDARADIYATGCLAYWLLTGQFVFSADTPIGIAQSTTPAPRRSRRWHGHAG
jgi:serine/threonine-protein kinase